MRANHSLRGELFSPCVICSVSSVSRASPSPYIGDGSVLYRSVRGVLVCSFVAPRYAEYEGERYIAVIRGTSPVNPPRIIYLRAVAISILVVRGVVMGSSILVLLLAVATFSRIG